MIATGGLLRINARRQDSLRSKPQRAHKKKSKNKRRSEVVVVKAKLKLCSVSGLVAVLGIVVLLLGVLMAALGYWPRDGLFFSSQPQEGTAIALMSLSSPPPVDVQGEPRWEESDAGNERRGIINGTTEDVPRGFLEDFLERYLYSDRLKVFGPLIMGIGIFLFICANAVLHENRDKKTKVINLRDIYSTVIDLHSVRKARPSSAAPAYQPPANPLNGLVNYVQSKGLDSRSRPCPIGLLSSRRPGSSRRSSDGGGTVFSIYQEQLAASPTTLPQTSLPCCTSLQQEGLSSFTLPRSHQQSPGPRRRHSCWAGTGRGDEEATQMPPSPLFASTPPPHKGSEGVLLLSSSSLSSLSHLLSSPSTPVPPCRRRSLPSAAFNTAYSKLTQGEEESFKWSSSHKVRLGDGAKPSPAEDT